VAWGIADRARRTPDQIALWCGDLRVTWARLSDDVARVAGALSNAGVAEGDRIAIVAENSYETVVAHLGALHSGAVSVPVSYHLTAAELAYIVGDSGARTVFASSRTAGTALAASARVPSGPAVVAWGTGEPGTISWESFLDSAPQGFVPGDVMVHAGIAYTSGTTGFPKGVDLARLSGGPVPLSGYLEQQRENPFARHGPHLVAGPLYHMGPLNGVKAVAVGTPLVVMPKFDAEAVLAAVDEHRIGSSVMVPTHFFRLDSLPPEVKQRYDVGSLEFVSHTGAACPAWLKRKMISWWGPVLVEAYGATESGTVCRISSSEWLERPGSVGRVIAPVRRAFAVDADDNELPAGEIGQLYFERTDGLGVEYLGDPGKSLAANRPGGGFTLGEIGKVDPDGYVYITDRATDMILSGGVNIYPAECEAVLLSHSDVLDAVVVGMPDDEMGEKVVAVVVRDKGSTLDAQQLLAYCRQSLSPVKCPRVFHFVDDLERNAMGKVRKADVRRRLAGTETHLR